MTPDIALVFVILAVAVVLFITDKLRVDVVALLVLGSLALSGLVTPAEALSGFSNSAVITVWAVFILSGGLSSSGVANVIGRQVLRLAGRGELRLLVVIMLTAGIMSAFMNNVGVAALLLPVVMDIARRTGRPPSKLLMPLAFGSLLGGLTTLIGTPPNILASDALRDFGLRPFGLFDYTPVGLVVMLAGVLFMALVGRRLLPTRDMAREGLDSREATDLNSLYELSERVLVMRLPPDSLLDGKTLAESRLGSAVGLNVVAVIRDGKPRLMPSPAFVLRAADQLMVTGRLDQLDELRGRQHLIIVDDDRAAERLTSEEMCVGEAALTARFPVLGQTLLETDFRRRFGMIVLAITRQDNTIWSQVDRMLLQAGDRLLVFGSCAQLDALRGDARFQVVGDSAAAARRLRDRLILVEVPADSILAGKSLADSRLADTFGLTLLGIVRQGVSHLMPALDEQLQAGDRLLVKGSPNDLSTLRGLQTLEIDTGAPPSLHEFETERISMSEVVLSPHTTLSGKNLRQIHFREKYGLSVLAIWREGRAYRSRLRDMDLRFGDALLLYGPREKLKVLGSEPDFLVLTEEAQAAPRLNKAPLAALVMAGVLLPVILGWLPISIAAVVGGTLMVLLGCLTMEEAYRYIEWKAVFLIAGMLPLGIAMEQTGAARLLAEGVVSALGGLGPLAVMSGLFVLTALATQVMPNPAVTVLMAPIAIGTATDLGLSPYAFMMLVALAASASFLSPVSHPANVLIMGPGGYRFTDYLRVGLPLTAVVLVVTLLVLPLFWPLQP